MIPRRYVQATLFSLYSAAVAHAIYRNGILQSLAYGSAIGLGAYLIGYNSVFFPENTQQSSHGPLLRPLSYGEGSVDFIT